ncbi:MAG: hypothetical protein Q9178_002142 [Gyalolechia marmorata]
MRSSNLLVSVLFAVSSFALPSLSDGRYKTTLNEQTTLNDGAIFWEKATSKKGMVFEIGKKKSGDDKSKNCDVVVTTTKEDFGLDVNWPLGNSDWKGSSTDVQSTAAITRYALHSSSFPRFDFVLEFTNTVNYNYHFYDQTGDSYQVNTYDEGNHYVRFNSAKPTILFVTGS